MKKIDPFLCNLPYIDVHGYDENYCIMSLKNFINESLLLKEYKIYIIHGKGKHILKTSIHEYLKNDKRIEDYYIYNLNDGLTIIELKKEKV